MLTAAAAALSANGGGATIAVAVLLVAQVCLLVYALVDLARRPSAAVSGGNRLLWLLLCLFVQFIGPLIYLTVGRVRAEREVREAPLGLVDGTPGGEPAPEQHATSGGRRSGSPEAAPAPSAAADPVARAAAALFDAAGDAPPPGAPASSTVMLAPRAASR